jgi:hypothetical protein
VSAGRYALGAVSLLTVCVAIGFAAFRLRRRLLPDHTGALGALAGAVIGLGLLVGLLELLGALGVMWLGPVVGGALAIAGWQLLAGRPARPAGFFATGRRSWMSVLACIAALAVLAQWLVPTLISYDYGITSVDSLWYHLPWAASFAQTGGILAPRYSDVEYLTAFYPATAEILHALGIVLIGRDTLSPALNLPFLAMTLLAGWCIGLERGMAPARVALGGTFGSFFAYPLWGLDDSNRVQYIARSGPHGSFTPISTCAPGGGGHWRPGATATW